MHKTVDSRSPPLAYLPFPLALKHLRERLGASPHEVAAWLFLSGRTRLRPEGAPPQSGSAATGGPAPGELHAYLHANELDEPPRFSFDASRPIRRRTRLTTWARWRPAGFGAKTLIGSSLLTGSSRATIWWRGGPR